MRNLFFTCIFLSIITSGYSQWTELNSGTTKNLTSIYFVDTNTGYAVGGTLSSPSGIILKTTNAGIDWIIQTASLNYRINSVFFTSFDVGYVVGMDGTILKTTNGGSDWFTLNYNTTNDLYSIYFTDSITGYIAGENGTILKTINAGNDWILQQSGTQKILSGIYFINNNIGYIVGGDLHIEGTILKTTDGGSNWTFLSSGMSEPLYSIYFTDDNIGYATGWQGSILKTTNAGVNWTLQNSGTNYYLLSCNFLNNDIGYIVGYDGLILKTINAGQNWNNISIGMYGDVRAISFTDTNTGYIVGDGGVILKTTTGGEILIPANAEPIAGDNEVCQGHDTVTYTVPLIPNSTSYIWTLPNGTNDTTLINSITLNFDSLSVSGILKVKGHNNYGDGVEAALQITINENPPIPLIQHVSNMLISSAPNGNQWYFNSNLIDGAIGQVLTPTQVGEYFVVVSVNNCSTQSLPFSFSSGIDETSIEKTIKIFPNPSNNKLKIEFLNPQKKLVKITILDMSGKEIFNANCKDEKYEFNNNLGSGTYILKVLSDIIKYEKIIIE